MEAFSQVENDVRYELWYQVNQNHVEKRGWNQVWNHLENQVRGQVWNQVSTQVWDRIRNKINEND